jgi:hypothetical protein
MILFYVGGLVPICVGFSRGHWADAPAANHKITKITQNNSTKIMGVVQTRENFTERKGGSGCEGAS